MALKLFRSTGYSSILMAGETRLAMHPGWMILAMSGWTGFACNVSLWRGLAGNGAGMGAALALALGIAGTSAFFISLLGWRKTIKPAATLVLFVAGLCAGTIWSEGLAVDGTLLANGMAGLLLPSWPNLFRIAFWFLLGGLVLLPMMWLWNTPLRRLSAQKQLRVNIVGAFLGALAIGLGSWLLLRAAS